MIGRSLARVLSNWDHGTGPDTSIILITGAGENLTLPPDVTMDPHIRIVIVQNDTTYDYMEEQRRLEQAMRQAMREGTHAFQGITSANYNYDYLSYDLEEIRRQWSEHLDRVCPGLRRPQQYHGRGQNYLARSHRRGHIVAAREHRKPPLSPSMKAHRKWMRRRMRL